MGDDTSQKKPERPSKDVVLIHGVTEDGKGLEVLRARDERLEMGQVRPLEHGKPLQGEVVQLRPREGAPFVCDVETQVSTPVPRADTSQSAPGPRKGPAQVSSSAYRQNWEVIWSGGSGRKKPLLN